MAYPFADLALARRLERTEGAANQRLVDARARLSPERGACWMEAGGAFAMFDGAASPLTQTFGLGLFETPTDDILIRLETFFRERRAPVSHETSPLADAALMPLLVARGYAPSELSSVMFRPIGRDLALAAPKPSASVALVEGDDDERWARTAAEGWSEFPGLAEFMLDIGRVQAAARDTYRFLATAGARAIAAGALIVHEGVGLLAGASTVPGARRQGAQLALLDARLRFAAEQGCDLAMMVALPGSGSQRNAERHGFRIAYTRIKWQRS
jgi:hypothetical protein